MESLSNFRPSTGTLDQWNAAYLRTEDYLRAHRIHNRLHQSRLIEKILQRAAKRHAETPQADPVRLAAEETELIMDQWFATVLGQEKAAHERIATDGRVALLLCDGPKRWPYAFLDTHNVPEDFRKAMQESSMKAGPDLAVSNMVPRPIDLGPITEVAGETLDQFEKMPILRTLALWALFLGILAFLFYISR